ncbi:unnamed protein product, partial [Pylaiella littoralis]
VASSSDETASRLLYSAERECVRVVTSVVRKADCPVGSVIHTDKRKAPAAAHIRPLQEAGVDRKSNEQEQQYVHR